MKKIILFFSVLGAFTTYGQKNFKTLVEESQKTGKLVLINVNVPERQPELSPMDPLNMSFNACYDGGCTERIANNFLTEKYLTTEDNGKELISKYKLRHYPVTLIFDSKGELVTKCNTFTFGNEDRFKKIFPILTNTETAQQLKQIESKMYSANIPELKKLIAIKDSLNMTDKDMIDLFVEKAIESDYDKDIQELLLRFTDNIVSPSESKIIENINKYLKNYTLEDDMEYQRSKLQEDYRLALFSMVFYAYRTYDEQLFRDKISEAKKSPLRNEDIDEVIQGVSFMYFKATKNPEELFATVKPGIEKQILAYNPKAKAEANEFASSPGEQLADNLNNASYSYYEAGGRDAVNLKTALAWSKRSNTLVIGNPAFLDTYAHLLYLTGSKTEAIVLQKKAISVAKIAYKDNLDDPQVKEYLLIFDAELKKMEKGEF